MENLFYLVMVSFIFHEILAIIKADEITYNINILRKIYREGKKTEGFSIRKVNWETSLKHSRLFYLYIFNSIIFFLFTLVGLFSSQWLSFIVMYIICIFFNLIWNAKKENIIRLELVLIIFSMIFGLINKFYLNIDTWKILMNLF